ncbi:MAG TPA: hypothetical protein VG100_00715 [Xanthobacteraceae bacterium]|jgi:hypothetical protein|nr:hypothetical protein [Xanthobacteraceae bacterium]
MAEVDQALLVRCVRIGTNTWPDSHPASSGIPIPTSSAQSSPIDGR